MLVRSVSLDITIPTAPSLRLGTGGRILLPLLHVRKRTLRNFDLRDSDNSRLSLLTSRENGILSVAVLDHIGRLALRVDARRRGLTSAARLSVETRQLIDAVVFSQPQQSQQLQASFFSAGARRPMSEAGVLSRSRTFRYWVQLLDDTFIMYVPLDALDGERRVIKYKLDEELPAWPLTLPMRLGLEPALISAGASVLGSQSYHAEVVVPRELIIESAAIRRRFPGRAPDTIQAERAVSRAHLYVHDQPQAEPYSYTVDIQLRTRPDGLLQAAFGVGVISTVLLLSGAILAVNNSVTVKADAATAVIVALPAAYAAYVAAQAENPLAERLLSALRISILVLAGASFLAALSLVARIAGMPTRLVWTLLGLLSFNLTCVLGVSWFRAMLLVLRR